MDIVFTHVSEPYLGVNGRNYHLKTIIDKYKTENVLELIACVTIQQQKEDKDISEACQSISAGQWVVK